MIKTVSLARMLRNTKTGTIPSASSRVSYYGAMKNQAGDGVATSPSVNVMNSQGEWQFSSQGADEETEFETVIYASETDSTTYRILDEGQFMSIVSAEDAQGSKVESFWTLRVTDRPKVCENAPATACTTSSDCSSGGTCGVRERSARISFFSFNYSEYSPRITTYPSFATIPLECY